MPHQLFKRNLKTDIKGERIFRITSPKENFVILAGIDKAAALQIFIAYLKKKVPGMLAVVTRHFLKCVRTSLQ